jgi:ActR/RegA family two-component response regulator/GGDEF domain-containing protein
VLVLSADPSLGDLVRAVLDEHGDEVEVVVDAADGVARAEASPPDLAFVDLSIGQGAALAIVHHVKALAVDADVIVLTPPALLEAAAQAISLGAKGLVLLPPSGDEIADAASRVRTKQAALRQRQALLREADTVRRALGYVSDIAALADRSDRDDVAENIAAVFQRVTGASGVLVYQPASSGGSELRAVAQLGEVGEPISFTDEMGLMRWARDADLEMVALAAGRLAAGHVLLSAGPWQLDNGIRASLGTLAAQATTTLSLVAERERSTRGAMKDPETSAYTFAYFVDIAGREIDKAHRHGRRFALATITTGDVQPEGVTASTPGDVAETVLSNVRDSDVLARIDERELYLLLPETNGLGAHACRRRVLGAGEVRGQDPRLVGVTMGIATFPHDGGDLLRLLRMAKRRADASRASVTNRLKLHRLTLPEIIDSLLWDVDIAQGKLEKMPETPFALELPVVDVLAVIGGVLAQCARGGMMSAVVTQRDGMGFLAGVRAHPASAKDGFVVTGLDVRHRDGCEDVEALAIASEHGAYALVGRVDHGVFHGVHAADPLLADLTAHRLAELAGVRLPS